MTLDDAQRDMRAAYVCGAPGMFVSALAWLAAGLVALRVSAAFSVLVLFVGGMFIHPMATVLCKLLGASGKHSSTNPLGGMAIEGLAWFLLCLPVSYAVSKFNVLWFFPAMLCVIGGRYLTFRTLYGLRIYWVCGAALALAAYLCAASKAPPYVGAFAGAAIEAAFALMVVLTNRGEALMRETGRA
jgi:hypothetical protein